LRIEDISRRSARAGSVAATIDTVIAQGGELVQPIGADAPEITARFRDLAGNVLGFLKTHEAVMANAPLA
jgi:hypothetical protein